MSVAIHPNTPNAVVGNGTTTLTTASFNVPRGAYITACLGTTTNTSVTGTASDNRSGSWSLLKRSNSNGTAEVWGAYYKDGTTGLTVSATFTGATNSATDATLAVTLLTGAASNQAGTTALATGTVDTIAVIPINVGSMIIGMLNNVNTNTNYVANAQTTILKANADATSGSTQWAFRGTNVTSSLGSVTYGSSTTAVTLSDIVAAEILPSNGLQNNYQFFSDGGSGDTGTLSFTERIR